MNCFQTNRDRKWDTPGRVDGDQPIHRSFQEKTGVLVDQVGTMAMTDHEIEITLLVKPRKNYYGRGSRSLRSSRLTTFRPWSYSRPTRGKFSRSR